MTSTEFIQQFNAYSDANFYATPGFGIHLYQGFAAPVFEAEIEWGDWKHEHLRLSYLVTEFCEKHGLSCPMHSEQTTEEDGSDTYSARHEFLIVGIEQ